MSSCGHNSAAFEALIKKFTSYPVLRNPDPNKCYILDTDVSLYAIGATLSQDFMDGRHSIAYFSKSLIPAERNYNIYDKSMIVASESDGILETLIHASRAINVRQWKDDTMTDVMEINVSFSVFNSVF